MPSYRRFLVPLHTAAASAPPASYGSFAALVQALARASAFAAFLLWMTAAAVAAERPVKIVALGDSLTAGLGLSAANAFPAKLEKALKSKGLAVEVVNAGVSGDTATGGLARLDWSVPAGTNAVIVELGANDMLRGGDPERTRQALDAIMRRLAERQIPVLLAGMRAAPNLGGDYARAFEPIYPELAAKYGLLYYPFFLEGVASDAKLNQRDGLHPTSVGIDAIVERMLPKVEELVAQARTKRGS